MNIFNKAWDFALMFNRETPSRESDTDYVVRLRDKMSVFLLTHIKEEFKEKDERIKLLEQVIREVPYCPHPDDATMEMRSWEKSNKDLLTEIRGKK